MAIAGANAEMVAMSVAVTSTFSQFYFHFYFFLLLFARLARNIKFLHFPHRRRRRRHRIRRRNEQNENFITSGAAEVKHRKFHLTEPVFYLTQRISLRNVFISNISRSSVESIQQDAPSAFVANRGCKATKYGETINKQLEPSSVLRRMSSAKQSPGQVKKKSICSVADPRRD